jgi:hypothetical protein
VVVHIGDLVRYDKAATEILFEIHQIRPIFKGPSTPFLGFGDEATVAPTNLSSEQIMFSLLPRESVIHVVAS